MRPIFTTEDVRPAEAFDFWMSIARANIQREVDSVPFDRPSFYGSLKVGMLGDVALTAWRAGPGITHCRGTDDLQLVLPSTRAHIEFADRSFELNRHGVCLVDCQKPYACASLEPPDRVQVRLPREILKLRSSLADAMNRPISLTPSTRLLVDYIHSLVRIGPSNLDPTVAALARDQLLELVAAVLPQPEPHQPQPSVFSAGLAGIEFARKFMTADILDAGQIADQQARALADAPADPRKTPDPSAPPSGRPPRRPRES